jgi:hypothetical protein
MPINSCAEGIPDFSGAFDQCNPGFVFGEIEEVIISPIETETGDPFPTDVEDEDAWDELLAPLAGDPVAFKIPVRGTIDEPDRPEVEASKYRKAYPPKRYSLQCGVDDLSQKAFDALRLLTNKTVRLWYLSGGYIFGTEIGIVADVDSWQVIEEGEDAMHRYHLHFTWRSKDAPKRFTSPFAPVTTPTPTT